jgi:ABC-type multidrug transport system ATPase subunit
MITIHNLSKYYGGRSSEPVRALEHFSLNIAPGEFLALLGPNGSGKSTLFRCMLGITDYEGSISIDGLDPLREGKSVRSRIGYMLCSILCSTSSILHRVGGISS